MKPIPRAVYPYARTLRQLRKRFDLCQVISGGWFLSVNQPTSTRAKKIRPLRLGPTCRGSYNRWLRKTRYCSERVGRLLYTKKRGGKKRRADERRYACLCQRRLVERRARGRPRTPRKLETEPDVERERSNPITIRYDCTPRNLFLEYSLLLTHPSNLHMPTLLTPQDSNVCLVSLPNIIT